MKIQFYLEADDKLVDEYKKKLTNGRNLARVDGMHFEVEEFGPCFTYWGYTQELPKLLSGAKIVRVVLEDDNARNFPPEGHYRRGTTFAVVDTGHGASADGSPWMWFMTVSGKTLNAVLRFYDDIRTGKVQPKVKWGQVNHEEAEATLAKIMESDMLTNYVRSKLVLLQTQLGFIAR